MTPASATLGSESIELKNPYSGMEKAHNKEGLEKSTLSQTLSNYQLQNVTHDGGTTRSECKSSSSVK